MGTVPVQKFINWFYWHYKNNGKIIKLVLCEAWSDVSIIKTRENGRFRENRSRKNVISVPRHKIHQKIVNYSPSKKKEPLNG